MELIENTIISYYSIAELVVRITSDNVEVQSELDAFKTKETDNIDVDIEIIRDDFNYSGKRLVTNHMLDISEDEESYIISYKEIGAEFIHGYKVFKNSNKVLIYADRWGVNLRDTVNVEVNDDPYAKATTGELLLYSIRDSFLFQAQKYGRIAVHSASLVYDNKAWLFAALSGVGKSTHVEMWKKAGIPCSDFNGDVAICYIKDGKAMAAGIPWSGTSKIFDNTICELGGVFFLQRDEKDYVKKLSLLDSTLKLNARCVSPNWSREVLERNISVSEEMVKLIVTGDLFCTPTTEAALVVKEYIDGGKK